MSMIKSSKAATAVMDTLHLLYKTYHYSPKSRRELKSIAEELGVSVGAPTRVRGTRWSPHILRALKILLKPSADQRNTPGQFGIIFQHMEHLAATSSNSDIKGRAKNVVTKMQNFDFLAFCHFMVDLFTHVSELSLCMQKNTVVLFGAINAIKYCMASIEALGTRPKRDGKLQEFFNTINEQTKRGQYEDLLFQGLKLTHIEIDEGELNFDTMSLSFRRSVNSATAAITTGFLDKFKSLIDEDADVVGSAKAVRCFSVFSHDKWPENRVDLTDFGDDEVKFLVGWFETLLNRYTFA